MLGGKWKIPCYRRYTENCDSNQVGLRLTFWLWWDGRIEAKIVAGCASWLQMCMLAWLFLSLYCSFPHRFQWSCHPVGNKDIPCFNESRIPEIRRNQSVLTFQMDWLLSHDTLEFAVTVSKDSRKFTALQILYVDYMEKSHLWVASQMCYLIDVCSKPMLSDVISLWDKFT